MLKFVPISSVADLTVGFVGTMATHYESTGVPFLRSLNIKPFTINRDDIKFISESFNHEIKKSILHSNDVVIVRTGVPGTCCVIPQEYDGCNCSDLVIIRPYTDKVDPTYLAAYINFWGRKQISNNKVGAVQQHFNVHSAEEMLVPLPSIEIQRETASLIKALNSKIETNNSIATELEGIAKDLYDYWFVQFDFPDGNGKPYKSCGGKMVWNEELKREIPDGWEVNKLGELLSITMGTSPAGNSINELCDGVPFYQGKADFEFRFPSTRTYTTSPIRFAHQGDTLLSVRAPVGELNKAINYCCIGRGIAAIHSDFYPSFAYYKCLSLQPLFKKYNSDGTTFGCIGKDDLYNMLSVTPPESVIKKFEKIVGKTDALLETKEKESRELKSLRDFLLPMLMNGQVSVREKPSISNVSG